VIGTAGCAVGWRGPVGAHDLPGILAEHSSGGIRLGVKVDTVAHCQQPCRGLAHRRPQAMVKVEGVCEPEPDLALELG
jgi:hypothetical protein